jgi:hypothetical protein
MQANLESRFKAIYRWSQASSQTMNMVGAVASSAGAHMYVRLYTHIA